MRESIGGTWLFGIVILFIALFASFLAYSITYTRAFNTKNEIINLIERYEGYTLYTPSTSSEDVSGTAYEGDVENLSDEQLKNDKSVEAQALYKIKKTGYNYSAVSGIDCGTVDGQAQGSPKVGGYCITKYCSKSASDEDVRRRYSVYYKVTTFIAMKIPVVNITFKIPISGETKTIYYDGSNTDCQSVYDVGR